MAWQDRAYNRNEGVPPIRFEMPPITRLSGSLIVVCLAIFFVQAFTAASPAGSALVTWGSLTFADGTAFKEPWRFITYQYLHAGGWHVFFNCLGLFFFVPPLERRWGTWPTLSFYTLGGIFAGLIYGMLALFVGPHALRPLVGASGSIMAAMGACALLFPDMQLIFFLFAIPIRLAAALFAILYFLTIIGDQNLADGAHLAGLAFGFFAPMLAGPSYTRLVRNVQVRRLRRMTVYEQEEQENVDLILQKVYDRGLGSLKWAERRALRRATLRQRQRDLELTRRHD